MRTIAVEWFCVFLVCSIVLAMPSVVDLVFAVLP